MQLTARERQIYSLLIEGNKGSDIAVRLGISVSTVRFHTKNIYKKMGVNSKFALIRKALHGRA